MRTLYDSTTVQDIPKSATMVAGYMDGKYQTVRALRARFPKAQIVTITVLGTPGAHVADVETGDLTPASGAIWAKREIQAGRKPTLYCSASLWPAVERAVRAQGISGKVSYWIAHYDDVAQIPEGAVAKQYRSTSKPNLDTSVAVDAPHWPGVDPAPVTPATGKPPIAKTVPVKAPVKKAPPKAPAPTPGHRLHLLHLAREHALHLLHLLRRRR